MRQVRNATLKNMAITLTVVGIILIVFGMVMGIKTIKPINFNLLAGIIIIIGTFFGLFGKLNQDKSSSEKSDNILNTSKSTNNEVLILKAQNDRLANQSFELEKKIEGQASTIDRLRSENTDLYGKLSSASNEIYNSINGGDSYCRSEVGMINQAGDKGLLIYSVTGKYSLSRVKARIIDLNTFDFGNVKVEDLFRNIQDIGTIDPNKAYNTKEVVKLDKIKGVNLNIFFEANNGFTSQALRMKFVNGKWMRANQIIRRDKIIFEEIDKGYPREPSENIFERRK